MKKKRLILDIIVGVIGAVIIASLLIYLKSKSKSGEYDPNGTNYTFNFSVVYEDNETVINDEIEFSEGETLFHILNRKYEITYRDDGFAKAITRINGYSTDWFNSYFALYVDGNYSTSGSEFIIVTNGMDVKLIWTSAN